MTWWCYWSDCRRSLNASASTSSIQRESISRPGWFLERRRTCRHLETAEDAGIAGNDLELPAVPWNSWTTPERVQPYASSDLEQHVQPAMEMRVWSGSRPKSLTIVNTDVGGLVRRWSTLLTNLAAVRWTISSWFIYFCWYGSHTGAVF